MYCSNIEISFSDFIKRILFILELKVHEGPPEQSKYSKSALRLAFYDYLNIVLTVTIFFPSRHLGFKTPTVHRTAWVGRDLEDNLVPTPLPRAGMPSTRPVGLKLCSIWP